MTRPRTPKPGEFLPGCPLAGAGARVGACRAEYVPGGGGRWSASPGNATRPDQAGIPGNATVVPVQAAARFAEACIAWAANARRVGSLVATRPR
jgi:hypothetical protein